MATSPENQNGGSMHISSLSAISFGRCSCGNYKIAETAKITMTASNRFSVEH
jgi:hypothetical protein